MYIYIYIHMMCIYIYIHMICVYIYIYIKYYICIYSCYHIWSPLAASNICKNHVYWKCSEIRCTQKMHLILVVPYFWANPFYRTKELVPGSILVLPAGAPAKPVILYLRFLWKQAAPKKIGFSSWFHVFLIKMALLRSQFETSSRRPTASACLKLSFLEQCIAGAKDLRLSG